MGGKYSVKNMRYIALTTCFLGLSGIALALIILSHAVWALWPIVFSIVPLSAVIKDDNGENKDAKGSDKTG